MERAVTLTSGDYDRRLNEQSCLVILFVEPKVDDYVTFHDLIFIMLIRTQKQTLTGLLDNYVIIYYVIFYYVIIIDYVIGSRMK